MKSKNNRIFVIIDPTSPQQLALVKAQLIAKLGNCHVHAFLCIYKDLAESGAYVSRKDFKRQSLAEAKHWLEQELQSLKISGLSYSTEVVWNSNWVVSAVRAIEHADCDLVVKSSYQHSKSRRFFSRTADFHLMRHCACPILFTHKEQAWQSDRLLACLDLESGDQAHARLNAAILKNAGALASIVAMELYVGCGYAEAINREHLPLPSHQSEVTAGALAEHFRLDEARVVLRKGAVVASLQAICAEVKPSIVVIGTLARRGVSGKLIGNTAEKLLDVIDADLMTVY